MLTAAHCTSGQDIEAVVLADHDWRKPDGEQIVKVDSGKNITNSLTFSPTSRKTVIIV